MNKVSSKLAASVRKVKDHEQEQVKKPEAAKSAVRETVAPRAATKSASASSFSHPERVWPD